MDLLHFYFLLHVFIQTGPLDSPHLLTHSHFLGSSF
jgi:hypothetical protein